MMLMNKFTPVEVGITAICVAVLVAALTSLAVGVIKVHNIGAQNHRALCALKLGYVKQRDDTVEYVKKHPDGIPALGLTSNDLLRTVKDLNLRIKSFDDVRCKK